MALIDIVIPGDPQQKERPRNARGRVYTPKRTREAEELLAAAVRAKIGNQAPVDRPVGLAAEFFCATRMWRDGDNLVKLVADALNGLIYTDDHLIEEYFFRVHRGVGEAAARTELFVWELGTAEDEL